MRAIDISIPQECDFLDQIRQFFEVRGFDFERIEEAEEERADFYIEKDNVRVLFELKIKEDDPDEAKRRSAILAKNEVYSYSESSLRRNRLSGVVRKGVSQLINTPGDWEFRLMWIHSAGHYAEHTMNRFRNTLYGMRLLFHTDTLLEPKPCYYYDESDFFRFRNSLTGVVLSEGNTDFMQLCINNHHSKVGAFRISPFRGIFKGACCDPEEIEAAGEAYIVEGEVNRSDEGELATYLTKKYDCGHTQPLDLAMHTYSARSE